MQLFPTMKLEKRVLALAVLVGFVFGEYRAFGQDVVAPIPNVPSATTPPVVVPAPDASLEQRVKDLEELNRRLSGQLEASERRHQEQMRILLQEIRGLRVGTSGSAGAATAGVGGSSVPGSVPSASAGMSAEEERQRAAPSHRGVSRLGAAGVQVPLNARFGDGFELFSLDDEFTLHFHQETQLDYREFDPNGEEFARSGFVIPRARAFFTGHMTKQWEYMFSFNRGFGVFELLDAWVNWHPQDWFQIRAGRFMTPFNYEQYAVQNMWLITPERSVFTANLGLNRMLGAQIWGQAAEKRIDYALGVFDGPRNSFEDFNDAKDIFTYLNVRPFQNNDDSLLRFLNMGGSFVYGMQDNYLVPASFRVASNASNAGTADRFAPPFFSFDRDVEERGDRMFWSASLAYFYKQLSVIADYNGAILRYAKIDAPASVVIPTHGYSIAAGYFLTGEEVERRTIVQPLRPFDLRRDSFGLGAWELVARYNVLNFDRDLLSDELTDPSLWSHEAWATNLGANWYLNRYVKIYFDWQHAEFGRPVAYRLQPLLKAQTNNLFWFRIQFYF